MRRYGLYAPCRSAAPAYPMRHGILHGTASCGTIAHDRTQARVRTREGWHPVQYGSKMARRHHADARCTAGHCAWRVRRCILQLYVARSRRVGGSAPKPRTSRRHCAGAHGAHPAHIYAGTGLTPPTGLGSTRPHLHRDCTWRAHRAGAHGAQPRGIDRCTAAPLQPRALHRCNSVLLLRRCNSPVFRRRSSALLLRRCTAGAKMPLHAR